MSLFRQSIDCEIISSTSSSTKLKWIVDQLFKSIEETTFSFSISFISTFSINTFFLILIFPLRNFFLQPSSLTLISQYCFFNIRKVYCSIPLYNSSTLNVERFPLEPPAQSVMGTSNIPISNSFQFVLNVFEMMIPPYTLLNRPSRRRFLQ